LKNFQQGLLEKKLADFMKNRMTFPHPPEKLKTTSFNSIADAV
jgi:hypothetical protein